MSQFNSDKVLRRILEDAPILSNLRGEIEVDGKKRGIYAYYYNRGAQDPELTYDKVKDPVETMPVHTLCEVYSFWEGDPNVQESLKRWVKEGTKKEGEIIYQGPWIHTIGTDGLNDPGAAVRGDFEPEYSFHHSASTFEAHFNRICAELGYDLSLVSLFDEAHGTFFDMGSTVVQSTRNVRLGVNGSSLEGNLAIRSPLGINLNKEDPTLDAALEAISQAYARIQTPKISDVKLYVGNP